MIKLTKIFLEFFESERAGGIVLLICTIISLSLANSFLQTDYMNFWHYKIGGMQIEHLINDGLMTVFFLLIGLELEREIYIGELSELKNSLLPISAALGGMIVPAGIHLIFNYGTETQGGVGIPMATDIAFALGILTLLGKRVPSTLKVFLTALAVIDDLGAIIIIAIFYSTTISFSSLGIAILIFILLIFLNRMKVFTLIPYLAGGIIMWYFILQSGIHPTITGVLLAFAIPFKGINEKSPSAVLQHFLHKPVAFFILPLFALANTSIEIKSDIINSLSSVNSIGIYLGLLLGKPIGIIFFSFIATTVGICSIPKGIKWSYLTGVGFLGGIGFTMSIFITLLAYNDILLITGSKVSVLIASVSAGLIGYLWLFLTLPKRKLSEEDS